MYYSSPTPTGLIGLGIWPHGHQWGDMIVLCSQYCLSSSNFKPRCCKICSPSQVASSLGISSHCTRYSLRILLLNILPLTYKIFFEKKNKFPSSSRAGNALDTLTCFHTAFFKQDKWNTLWILPPGGISSSYATTPIFFIILCRPYNLGWIFSAPFEFNEDWL